MATHPNDRLSTKSTTAATKSTRVSTRTTTGADVYGDSFDDEEELESTTLPTPPMFSSQLGQNTARIAGRAIKPLPSRARSAAVQFPFSGPLGSTTALGAKARWVPEPFAFTSLRSHSTGLLPPELTMPFTATEAMEDADEHEEYSPSDPLMLPPPNTSSMFPSIFDFPFIPFPMPLPFPFPPQSTPINNNNSSSNQSTPQVFESHTFPGSAEEWEYHFRESLRGAWPRLAHRFFACRFKTFMHVIVQTVNIPPDQERFFIDRMKSIADLPTSALEARVHEWDDWWKGMLKWRRKARKKGWLDPNGEIEHVVRDIMDLHERLLHAEGGMMRILGNAFITGDVD